ncbi:MAG: COX15/CtaA family protein, partial [Phycisphaerales bacterium]|nr:COX15/CtaA family protein [Phycisphaerales bacterium]
GRGFIEGMWVGILAAVLNLLLVASLLKSDLAGGEWWIAGILFGCVLVGGFGGAVGGLMRPVLATGAWVSIFAWVAVGVTFFMIVTGGIVTGFQAGLAVPDWPASFGHNMLLYPLTEMVSDFDTGIYFEHAHRLTGMFVGVTSIVLLAVLLRFDRRNWSKLLGALILLLVITQGILGGLRVTDLNIGMAIIHGVLAQVILALMAAVAIVTSRRWLIRSEQDPPDASRVECTFAEVLVLTLLVQLAIGAAYRHLVTDLGAKDGASMGLLMGHITMAVIVTVVTVVVGLQSLQRRGSLKPVGILLLTLVVVQLLLGVGSLVAVMLADPAGGTPQVSLGEVFVTSAHQANGALLLMTATVAALLMRRRLEHTEAPAAESSD